MEFKSQTTAAATTTTTTTQVVTLHHGTTVEFAETIPITGICATQAQATGGDGNFWVASELETAQYIASMKFPGATAVVSIEILEEVLRICRNDVKLATYYLSRGFYRFSPTSFGLLNPAIRSYKITKFEK